MPSFESALDHHLLLCDPVRVMAYRAAIFRHAEGRVVVDLGCGTGILSVFAAQAGARHVYAIERSRVAGLARLVFAQNGVADKVTLLRNDSRQVELPVKADIIVHEQFGHDPFAEGFVETVIDARTRLLDRGGRLIPDRVEVACAGLPPLGQEPVTERLKAEAREAGRLYGVDLEPYLMAVDAVAPALSVSHALGAERPVPLTDEAVLWDLDLHCDAAAEAAQARSVTLTARRRGVVGAVAVYSRLHLDETLCLSTAPHAPRTAWGLAVRELLRPVAVEAGDQVRLRARVEELDGRRQILVEALPGC